MHFVHIFGGKIGMLLLRLVESMRTLEQKVQPFAFGCSFEPHEYFWIIFCLEKSNPPLSSFFPACKALALSLPGPAMAEQSPGSDTHLSSLQAEPAPHHTQIKTIPAPMAFAAGSKGNTGSCFKTKSQVFKFHTFPFLWERGTDTTPGQKPSWWYQGPSGYQRCWETLRSYRIYRKTKHFSISLSTTWTLSPTKSRRGTALPWFSG